MYFTVSKSLIESTLTRDYYCSFFFLQAPEDLSPPTLEADSSTSVIIRWEAPITPNGIILSYSIERLTNTVTEIATLSANDTLVYIDEDDTVLQPFYTVSYRVVADNSAGSTASSYANITTLQARKFYSVEIDWRSKYS